MKRNFLFLLLSIAFAGYAQAQTPTTLPENLWAGLNPVFADLRIETSDGKPRTFYTVAKEFHLNLGDAVHTGTNDVVYKFDKTGFTCPRPITTPSIAVNDRITTNHFEATSIAVNDRITTKYLDVASDAKILGKLNLTGDAFFGKQLYVGSSSIVFGVPPKLKNNTSCIGSGLSLIATNFAAGLSPILNLYQEILPGSSRTWQISFSGGNLIDDASYNEYVHLQTTKSATGTSFAIRTLDNSGGVLMTTRLTVNEAGNVLIGGSAGYNNERLFVDGVVKASSFKTAAASFPDYVFESAYKLRSIEELSTYIQSNKKLPGMPSEQEVLKQGLDLSQVSTATVEKVEELSLYIIQLNERIKALEAKLAEAGK